MYDNRVVIVSGPSTDAFQEAAAASGQLGILEGKTVALLHPAGRSTLSPRLHAFAALVPRIPRVRSQCHTMLLE